MLVSFSPIFNSDFFFKFYVSWLHTCMHTMSMRGVHRSGKKTPDPLELELWVSTQTLCGCCKLNLGPLEEPSVFSLLNLSIPAPCF